MTRPCRSLTALLLAALLTGCSEPPAGIAIENVTVIDPVSGALADARVVVAEGRIQHVGHMSAPAPEVATRLDGTGRYLIPGLWDMHVHFLYDPRLTELMPGLFLDYGVTSVRDTGGNLAELVALRERLAAAPLDAAPSVYFSGPLLDGRFVVYDGATPAQPPLGTAIADPASARAYVAELDAAGADFIKIYELVAPEIFDALVAAAREHGLPIASHVPLSMTADQAGPSTGSMEHLRNLELACAANWEELLNARRRILAGHVEGRGYALRSELHALQRVPAIRAYDEGRCNTVLDALRGTIQVPTLQLNTRQILLPFDQPDWARALGALPPAVQTQWRAQAQNMRNARPAGDPTFSDWSLFLVGRMKERGVPIGAGTDTPIGISIPGWSLHTELELLVEAGLTPLEALHSATVVPARFFGADEHSGRVQPGMVADLVLLDANPLADIGATRRIRRVMRHGVWVR
jgi:cytosine/adenosine deaminase-related metal-dependent hydrolase